MSSEQDAHHDNQSSSASLSHDVVIESKSKHAWDKTLHVWEGDASSMVHNWYPQRGFTSAVCMRCHEKFSRIRKNGLKCSVCHARIHTHCVDSPEDVGGTCRPTFTRLNEYPPRHKLTTIHHWVAGYFDKSIACAVCNKSISAMFGSNPTSFRCAWCKRVVHADCMDSMQGVMADCDLGDYGVFLLGSADISLGPKTSRVKGTSLTYDDLDSLKREVDHEYKRTVAGSDSPEASSRPASSNTSPNSVRRRKPSKKRSLSSPSISVHRLSLPQRPAELDRLLAQQGRNTTTASTRAKALQRGQSLENTESGARSSAAGNAGVTQGDDDADMIQFHTARLTTDKRGKLRSSFRLAVEKAALARRAAAAIAVRGSISSDQLIFRIEPRPFCFPLIVLINPKSGGNQGARLLPQFQWQMNPRQVFNIMARDADGKPVGPRRALEIYQNVPNLRVLVCGGDGTVGWVLDTMDQLNIMRKRIPVGTIPLGTGNDMARSLKMGGGYEGEPIDKLLTHVRRSVVTKLDRWEVKVTLAPSFDAEAAARDLGVPVEVKTPQIVFNNYFSFGADAFAALSFHLAREANPQKFNSRIHNKSFYALQGAKDMFVHKYRGLPSMISLECDGVNYDGVLRRKKVEAIAFLNISSYGAGTRPWGTKVAVDSFSAPSMDDGLLEVVGFESALALARGQMRMGHALRICQCRAAKVVLHKAVALQMDGEPCMMAPCTIEVRQKNVAHMLCRPKGRFKREFRKGLIGRAFPARDGDDDEDDDDDDDYETMGPDSLLDSQAAPPDESVGPSSAAPRLSVVNEVDTAAGSWAGSPSSDEVAFGRSDGAPGQGSAAAPGGMQPNASMPSSPILQPASQRFRRYDKHSDTDRRHSPLSSPRTSTKQLDNQQHHASLEVDSSSPVRSRTTSGESQDSHGSHGAGAYHQSELGPDSVVSLFFVPTNQHGRTCSPRFVGAVSLPQSGTLSQSRSDVGMVLKVDFTRSNGWRFLSFEMNPESDDEGVYMAINRDHEAHLTIGEFVHPESRGVYFCRVPRSKQSHPLIKAVADGETSLVQSMIIDQDEPDAFLLDVRSHQGETVLHVAVVSEQTETLKAILDKYASEDLLDARDVSGQTALHVAAAEANLDAFKALLERGASLRMPDWGGSLPIDLVSNDDKPAFLAEVGKIAQHEFSFADLTDDSLV